MSVDRSLKLKSALARHRNVLTRAERVEHLTEIGKWDDDSTVLGMPKVGHRKAAIGKKKAKKQEEAAAGEETTEEKPAT